MRPLHFDPEAGIIHPQMLVDQVAGLPDTCLVTFSKTVMDHALARYKHELAYTLTTLNGPKPIYRLWDDGFEILLYMSPITSAGAGMTLEQMAQATGAKHFILFGSCGALDKQLTEGRLIVPTRAYRDEGFSHHYAPMADYIPVPNAPFVASFLDKLSLPYVEGGVWTTDALFRETRGKMDRRRSEGCIAVDMECAGLQALCDYRGYEYYTFFYTGDLLDAPAWEIRILDSEQSEADHQLAAFSVALALAKTLDARPGK